MLPLRLFNRIWLTMAIETTSDSTNFMMTSCCYHDDENRRLTSSNSRYAKKEKEMQVKRNFSFHDEEWGEENSCVWYTTKYHWNFLRFLSYFTVTYFDIRYMNKNKQSFSSNGDASSSTFQLQLAAVSRFWTLYARKQKKGVSLQLDIEEVSWTRSKPWIWLAQSVAGEQRQEDRNEAW